MFIWCRYLYGTDGFSRATFASLTQVSHIGCWKILGTWEGCFDISLSLWKRVADFFEVFSGLDLNVSVDSFAQGTTGHFHSWAVPLLIFTSSTYFIILIVALVSIFLSWYLPAALENVAGTFMLMFAFLLASLIVETAFTIREAL